MIEVHQPTRRSIVVVMGKTETLLLGFIFLLLPLLLRGRALPTNFLFGIGSSSYQYEGAYMSDGKGQSNWDNFTHGSGSIVVDGSNGDIAVDHYHRYLEDIELMEGLKVNSYKLSISWARVLPKGRFGQVNSAGIQFYNRLFDVLLQKGIQPFVVLSHYDSPQELEERYGAWLSPQSQEDFAFYADLCFKSFGDRVKYWATFNEPNYMAPLGYRSGVYPPSRCSGSLAMARCTGGDSEKEPFIAAHNIILSHAAAVDIYRTKYQSDQKGVIGIVLQHEWFEPISNSTEDKLAAERARSFTFNWFLDPMIFGKYPTEMENLLGGDLPKFSRKEKEKLKKLGLDFVGINYYTAHYIQDCLYSECKPGFGTTRTEGSYQKSGERNGISIGEATPFSWLNIYPEGMEKTIAYVRDRYNTPMYITENGYGQQDDPNLSMEEELNDFTRIKCMKNHAEAMLSAIRKGADVRGYFAWSLLDNFEWIYGYTVRYGLHHVDYTTLKRTPRLSATWYTQFIEMHKEAQPKLVQIT